MITFRTLEQLRLHYANEHGSGIVHDDGEGQVALRNTKRSLWDWWRFSERHDAYVKTGSTERLGPLAH